ncbi:efflux RND transporter periplasmic adaptor subunit [Halopseudomonas aestusnigri]|uniref:Membrane fusion protein, multidrug efflux system n=1 Tax=Halopseudomonas aestusnigri TaxID=857252 RepID=A0AAQ1JPQ6_9GAMM|nr:efflux RND transporter periplasmic adaptor subunit [Halopseudomonas aestusnigri]OWL89829.1 multidrug transporter subunit MdtA [Halopseudomonas aestusnigri]SEG19713.1 membrane fusion protein, multidrug efflux system [Halopseudomonas aestusnigri]
MSLPQSSLRSLRNWLLLAAAVAGAGTFAWFQFGSQTAPVQPDALRRMGWDAPAVVRVEPAALGQLDVQIKSIGTVTPLNTVTVQSRVSGVLEKVVFEEGARVEQGALLAEIDPLPYRAQLEQAEGQLQQNRAKLENARADLKLYEQLWEQDSIARQQLSDQRALVQELLGTVRANQAQVDDARLQLSWTRITAPLSGRLGLRKVDQGNLVTGSEAEGLVSITQTQPIAVNFTVPEVDVPALRDARRGDAPLKVEVLDRGEQRVLATGELTTLDNQIDTSTGTLRVRAQFANEDEALFPNQFVNVHLRLKTLESVVTIPGDAVQFGTERNYVYVVQDNKAYVRNVMLGAAADGRVAVTDGLEPGELVVLEGLDRLRDGKQVNIPDASGAAAGAARTPATAGERRGPPPAN